MMKKTFSLLFGMTLLAGGSFAQADEDYDNMVVNPGFEDHEGKIKGPGSLDAAAAWWSSTGEGADIYFAKAKKEEIQVPENQYGRQKTDDGQCYAGIRVYSYQNKQPRSYITTQLNSPMKTGGKYCVKYDVVLADLSKYATNNMSTHFSKKKVMMDSESDLAFEDVMFNEKNVVIEDMDIWTTVCNLYEASGGEKYMTIGNFRENDATEEKKMKRPKGFTSAQKGDSYYFIDNVRVYMVEQADECKCGDQNEATPSIIYSSQVISEDELSAKEIVSYSKVYFDYIKDKIENAGVRDLSILARTLEKNPEFNLTVKGHTDRRESEYAEETGFYKDLAQKRANKVVDFLVSKGISKDRLEIVVVDDKEPVDTNGTEIGKAKNRRVEFILK